MILTAAIALGDLGIDVAAQTASSPDADASRAAHLQRKIAIYRAEREKIKRGAVSESLWQHGQDLDDFGMQAVEELRDQTLTTMRDVVSATEKGLKEKLGETLFGRMKGSLDGAEAVKKLYDTAKASQNLTNRGTAKLDHVIVQLEALDRPIALAVKGETGSDPLKAIAEGIVGGSLAGLYLVRASAATSDQEKLDYRAKAVKKTSDAVIKGIALDPEWKAAAYGSKAFAEVASRWTVWAVAVNEGMRFKEQAEMLKANAITELNHRIWVTQWELDQVKRREERLAQRERVKEPGGIKFSGSRADDLARMLDVTAVDYDPIRGQLVLVGRRSNHVFELDVFADVLRLAAEKYEPFFSLESSKPEDWDFEPERFARELARAGYSDQRIAARIRRLSPPPIEHEGRLYYYATADEFDRALFARANEGRDITDKLVFSPVWLRHSKVGWILYEADLAIKSVASGFLWRNGAAVPAPVWNIAGFKPEWTHRDRQNAGRANFELDQSVATHDDSARIDLSGVRPMLDVVERRAGTTEDLERTERCLEITNHFREHWREYVDQVPELSRLAIVFRSYVAARFLIKRHPGLAARIQQLPRTPSPEQPPLRTIRPSVLRAAYEGGRLVPIVRGTQGLWDIGGGFGGGIAFKTEKKVAVQRTASLGSYDWVRAARAGAGHRADWIERGDAAAAVVEFEAVDRLPSSRRYVLGLAVAVLATLAAAAAMFLRRLDWQHLAVGATCAHCGRVHETLGWAALAADALALGAVYYVGTLPLVVAAHDASFGVVESLATMLWLAGLTAGLFLLGTLGLTVVARVRKTPRPSGDIVLRLLWGARLMGVFLGTWLLSGGFSADAVGRRFIALLWPLEPVIDGHASPQIGERLLLLVGSPGPIAVAAAMAATGALAAIALRRAVPYMLDTRPLGFESSGGSDAHP